MGASLNVNGAGPWGRPRRVFLIGRSERIRTSDPLLPKQVRYQTALRSDRGRGVKRLPQHLQGVRFHSLRSGMPRRCIITLTRGMDPVSGRLFVPSTGR